MRIGYGWVSTRDQNPDGQRDALTAAGCDEIYVDKVGGGDACVAKQLGHAANVSSAADGLAAETLNVRRDSETRLPKAGLSDPLRKFRVGHPLAAVPGFGRARDRGSSANT